MRVRGQKKPAKKPVWSVAKVSTFEGNEGPGFSCELQLDGLSVCQVLEEGNGGGVRFRWYDIGSPRVDRHVPATTINPHAHDAAMTPWEASFHDHVMERPVRRLCEAHWREACVECGKKTFEFKADMDWRVGELAWGEVAISDLKRKLARAVLFVDPKRRGVLKYNAKSAAERHRVITVVHGKYPKATILNELFVEDPAAAVRLYDDNVEESE